MNARHRRQRFFRRFRAWANYVIIIPRWFYLVMVFMSGWGFASLGIHLVETLS